VVNPLLYELPTIGHVDVETIEEALLRLQRHGEKARVIAGGTDLLGLMKDGIGGPQLPIPDTLINIKSIPAMGRITEDGEEGLRIGAAVTLTQLETSEAIKKKFPILSQAARRVGTTQIRYMGTLGGNICQRPRCLYFRHPDFLCYKKGGEKCYALTGEHRYYHSIMRYGKCVMAHPSDLAPALIALKAKAVIAGFDGERQVFLQDFFLGANHFTETTLNPDELLAEVRVPYQGDGTYQRFLKHGIRHSADFSLASVAVVARMSQGGCKHIQIVLAGVAPFPLRASKTEEIIDGKKLEEGLISKAAEAAVEGAKPLPMNRYKVDLTKTLVKRVLTSIHKEAVNKS
jgi:xanthine dehydrogenase YagS FAD-binding subunit